MLERGFYECFTQHSKQGKAKKFNTAALNFLSLSLPTVAPLALSLSMGLPQASSEASSATPKGAKSSTLSVLNLWSLWSCTRLLLSTGGWGGQR